MKQKDIGIFSSIGENADYINKIQAACDKASENIQQRVSELGNIPVDKAQGLYAEAWHAETFNADTVLNRMDGVKAEVLKSNGYKSVDVTVTDNGETVANYSLKYYKHGKASVDAQKGYEGQERLIPSDQVKDGSEYLKKQIAKDRSTGRENRIDNAQDLEDVQNNLTGKINYGEAESESLSRKEAEKKLKEARQGEHVEIQPQIDAMKIADEALRSGAVAAGITISMTVAPRIYNSLAFRYKQGEWPPDALKTILEGTASAGTEAGLRGAVATSLTMSAKAGLLGEAMKSADPTIIGTMTYIAFEGVKDFNKYSKGEITGEILADSLMAKSVGASAGAYGAAIGQAVIPVPIVGAMIGAMIGSIVAQHGYQLLDTVAESYYRSKEFEEMKNINFALANQWNELLINYNNWLSTNKYYQEQKNIYINGVNQLDAIEAKVNTELNNALGGNDE